MSVPSSLLDDTSLGRLDEIEQEFHLSGQIAFAPQFFERLRRISLFGEQGVKSMAQALDGLVAKPAALESDGVDAVRMRAPLADGLGVGENIAGDHGVATDESMRSDAAELMHAAERPDGRVIVDGHMTRERGGIGQNDVISQMAVVGDVSVRH